MQYVIITVIVLVIVLGLFGYIVEIIKSAFDKICEVLQQEVEAGREAKLQLLHEAEKQGKDAREAKVQFLLELEKREKGFLEKEKERRVTQEGVQKKQNKLRDKLRKINSSIRNTEPNGEIYLVDRQRLNLEFKKCEVVKLRHTCEQYILSGLIKPGNGKGVVKFIDDLLLQNETAEEKFGVAWDLCFKKYIFDIVYQSKQSSPDRPAAPEEPSLSKVREEYEKWTGHFRKYRCKFFLGDGELKRFQALLVKEWEIALEKWKAQDSVLKLESQINQANRERDEKLFDLFKILRQNCVAKERELYVSKDEEAVQDYVRIVLYSKKMPSSFPINFDVQYTRDNGSLVVDYQLPCVDDLPKIKEKRWLKTKDDYKVINFKQRELDKMYDELLYKLTLSRLYILFQSDEANALNLVTFNGWVRYVDEATGNYETACVLSIQCTKEELSAVTLSKVDPKKCFKGLKGVCSSKLAGMAAVRPILLLDRNDRRFVSSYPLEEAIDEGENIAIMPWEDFEHLIRGLFDREFNQYGGEVKVTQASRDGGVDAVAFDPDPIRGGKIVIQAKRYINTVGVSAVRDLFGTVHNEGANKGILVTTADYGPEAYKFAKDKPLTLLNGNNLLHMLKKHGHKARIDLKEARKYFADNEGK
ncbi:restriction endonuclease [Oligoflexia bacterium]|nr:restriction endonuclease [Oligoflexia bacterium]